MCARVHHPRWLAGPPRRGDRSPPTGRRGGSGITRGDPLLGLLQDLHDAPALGRGQRSGLHQADPVADTGDVRLVVGLVLRGPADDLAVQRVLDAVLHLDDDSLVHLVADDVTLARLAVVTLLRRGLLTHSAASFALSADSSAASGMMPSSCSRSTV